MYVWFRLEDLNLQFACILAHVPLGLQHSQAIIDIPLIYSPCRDITLHVVGSRWCQCKWSGLPRSESVRCFQRAPASQETEQSESHASRYVTHAQLVNNLTACEKYKDSTFSCKEDILSSNWPLIILIPTVDKEHICSLFLLLSWHHRQVLWRHDLDMLNHDYSHKQCSWTWLSAMIALRCY